MLKCNLKKIMDSKGKSISEISRKTGICHQAIRNYRNNNLKRLTINKVMIICSTLKCSVKDLFEE